MEYDVKDADRLGDSRLDCRLFLQVAARRGIGMEPREEFLK